MAQQHCLPASPSQERLERCLSHLRHYLSHIRAPASHLHVSDLGKSKESSPEGNKVPTSVTLLFPLKLPTVSSGSGSFHTTFPPTPPLQTTEPAATAFPVLQAGGSSAGAPRRLPTPSWATAQRDRQGNSQTKQGRERPWENYSVGKLGCHTSGQAPPKSLHSDFGQETDSPEILLGNPSP